MPWVKTHGIANSSLYLIHISFLPWLLKQKSLTVGLQCLASLQPLVHMQQQVKSFLEFSKWSSIHLNHINNFFKTFWKDLTKVLSGLVKNFFLKFFNEQELYLRRLLLNCYQQKIGRWNESIGEISSMNSYGFKYAVAI